MPPEIDPTDLAAQEHQEQQRQIEHEGRRLQEIADIKWLLSDKRGRRIYWRLLTLTHMFHTSFRTNALDMARLEGERNLGLQLWNDLHGHAPEAYPQMVKEQRAHGNGNTGDREQHKR